MKKIAVSIIMVLIAFLSGCVTTGISTTVATTTVPVEYIESKEELLALLSVYRMRFAAFAVNSSEAQAALPDDNVPILLSDGILVDRDELPPQITSDDHRAIPRSGAIFALAAILDEAGDAIAACPSFLESTDCMYLSGAQERHIRVHLLGDALSIDWYAFNPESFPGLVSPKIEAYRIAFDIVDGFLRLELARDTTLDNGNFIEHYRWYDRFDENGEYLSIYLDMMRDETFYYDAYGIASGEIFHMDANYLLERNTSITYLDTGKTFSDTFYPNGMQAAVYVSYGYRSTVFSYFKNTAQTPHEALLGWNLYLASGWNRARLYDFGSDLIYQDEEALLTDFWIMIHSGADPSAMAYFSLPAADIDEEVIDLSEFGLLFDAVSCDDVIYDMAYAPTDLINARARYGVTGDVAADREMMLSKIPLGFDQDLIDGFFD